MLPWYFIEHIMTSKSKKSLKNANKYEHWCYSYWIRMLKLLLVGKCNFIHNIDRTLSL
jgi:hypothetical protein